MTKISILFILFFPKFKNFNLIYWSAASPDISLILLWLKSILFKLGKSILLKAELESDILLSPIFKYVKSLKGTSVNTSKSVIKFVDKFKIWLLFCVFKVTYRNSADPD